MDPEVETLIDAWHWMYFETDLAFRGLSEENLHRRPSPCLLSVSENVAHVARSEASIVYRYLLGQQPDAWADCLFREAQFGWPPTMLEGPVSPELVRMSSPDVMAEYLRQHERCYAMARDLKLPADHLFTDGWDRICTVRDRLRIAAYHVAYHTGQIYSARHALGETTPDN